MRLRPLFTTTGYAVGCRTKKDRVLSTALASPTRVPNPLNLSRQYPFPSRKMVFRLHRAWTLGWRPPPSWDSGTVIR